MSAPAPQTDGLVRGIIPVVPTIFHADESLDLPGLRRTLDYLVDAGSDMVCLLANYGEQFSLSDTEREQVLTTAIDQVADRVPVCVTISHYATRIAAERARHAVELGADMLMAMPPFFGLTMKVSDDVVIEHFAAIAEGIEVPIMVQDAPMSTTPLSASLLARLGREVPAVRYAKVETARAAATIRTLAATAPELPGLYDGEEAVTLIPDLKAGAIGCMSSSLLAHELGGIVRDFHAGRTAEAEQAWEGLLPLIQFENRQLAQTATKVVLAEAGIIDDAAMRHPFAGAHPEDARQIVELARRRDIFALRWGQENR